LTLLIVFLLLYLNFNRIGETLIVLLSVPFALVGGVWLLFALDYNLSVAVAVGFIALVGVAAETGVVMLIYLNKALEDQQARCRAKGTAFSRDDLLQAVMEGAVLRVRPKMMTVVAIMAGLLPIMWGTGTGSEVMRRIAAPMVGGMVSATVLTLIVIPAIYALLAEARLTRLSGTRERARSSAGFGKHEIPMTRCTLFPVALLMLLAAGFEHGETDDVPEEASAAAATVGPLLRRAVGGRHRQGGC
jgi:predicted RND superfamily exporter protein